MARNFLTTNVIFCLLAPISIAASLTPASRGLRAKGHKPTLDAEPPIILHSATTYDLDWSKSQVFTDVYDQHRIKSVYFDLTSPSNQNHTLAGTTVKGGLYHGFLQDIPDFLGFEYGFWTLTRVRAVDRRGNEATETMRLRFLVHDRFGPINTTATAQDVFLVVDDSVEIAPFLALDNDGISAVTFSFLHSRQNNRFNTTFIGNEAIVGNPVKHMEHYYAPDMAEVLSLIESQPNFSDGYWAYSVTSTDIAGSTTTTPNWIKFLDLSGPEINLITPRWEGCYDVDAFTDFVFEIEVDSVEEDASVIVHLQSPCEGDIDLVATYDSSKGLYVTEAVKLQCADDHYFTISATDSFGRTSTMGPAAIFVAL